MPPTCGPAQVGAPAAEAQVHSAPPPLPPIPAADRPLLARLLALSENYPALAAELAAGAHDNRHNPDYPKDLLDLYAWADQPHIAAWLAHHRQMTDLQRRTLALTTLEEIIKTSPTPTERRRSPRRPTTLLRALDHKWPALWNRPRERSASSPVSRFPSAVSRSRGSYVPSPPPLSTPTSSADPAAAIETLAAAFKAPQPTVALSTLHAHTAPNATFAAHPVSEDPAEWIATVPAILPSGFCFPFFFQNRKETERTQAPSGEQSRWIFWLQSAFKDAFRCTLTSPRRVASGDLIRDGPDTPNSKSRRGDPCWRIAAFNILHRSG